jgi:hypothetical protein
LSTVWVTALYGCGIRRRYPVGVVALGKLRVLHGDERGFFLS